MPKLDQNKTLSMLDMSPEDFGRHLAASGIRRFSLVWNDDESRVVASHPDLDELARFLTDDPRDFDRHEGIFVQVAPSTGELQGAFVHRTKRGQGAGGVRYWSYPTVAAFLRDGLRLSVGMTLKSALAGLWWGGGKGVIARNPDGAGDDGSRREVFQDFGRFLTGIGGCYIAAEDVGTTVDDVAAIFSTTRFTTCIPPEFGGSGNPSPITAAGVACGMEAALDARGMGEVRGKKVVLHGLGQVGQYLAKELHDRGVGQIVASDIVASRPTELAERFPGVEVDFRLTEKGNVSILAEPCDVLAPCATGGSLSPETIETIAAPIVCGAANNQLADPSKDDLLLHERGILYVPDFLINRMGIVQCADEQYGVVPDDPRIARHFGRDWDNSIYNLTREVIARSEAEKTSPHRVALALAEERSHELHPIWRHRGQQIVGRIAASDWSRGR